MDFKTFIENRNLSNLDIEINQMIGEMLNISLDADSICKEIIKFIEEQIKIKDKFKPFIKKIQKKENNGYGEVYELRTSKMIFNHMFDFDIVLYNSDDIDDKSYNDILPKTLNMDITSKFDSESNKVKFNLKCNLFLKNWKIPKITKSILSHECRHAYESMRHFDDRNKDYILDYTDKNEKYKKLYNTVTDIIKSYENHTYHIDGVDIDNFVGICCGIYYSDIQEISAFTQHDFELLKGIDDDKYINMFFNNKDSQLYKAGEWIKKAINVLETDNKTVEFTKQLLDINDNQLLKILKKRYKKVIKNISHTIIAVKTISDKYVIERFDCGYYDRYRIER